MIRGMVSRLADRLKQNGNDLEGWQRLLRAYMVLGQRDKANAAVVDAKRALAPDPDKLRRHRRHDQELWDLKARNDPQTTTACFDWSQPWRPGSGRCIGAQRAAGLDCFF